MGGEHEQNLLIQCRRHKQPLPKQLRDSPSLATGLELFWDAYVELNTCRVMGGPIPWTAIRDYADEVGIHGFQREALFVHVRAMDVAFLSYNKLKEK